MLRPRRNFRIARRGEKQGEMAKTITHARTPPASEHVSVIERGAPHSERGGGVEEKDEHSQFMTGKDPRSEKH